VIEKAIANWQTPIFCLHGRWAHIPADKRAFRVSFALVIRLPRKPLALWCSHAALCITPFSVMLKAFPHLFAGCPFISVSIGSD